MTEKPKHSLLGLGDIETTKGFVPESWQCIDCGFNTHPGGANRAEIDAAFSVLAADPKGGVLTHYGEDTEVYTVREAVWKRAGMEPWGGCLCIGCLENRIGRRLKPKDFPRDHAFNNPNMPGTPRLLSRRHGWEEAVR